ncbi:MAG: DNA-directed RNA polymerase subunit A' [Candidatus Micrarchaeota archaeon]|nr:DNA-directed RNA polymerase subunit A' [Candidatus Micrarchaeota archaeon]
MKTEVIDYIKFGVVNPDQIKKLSVAKLSVPDTYNEDGYPIEDGLLDQKLGVIDPGLICKTCGARAKTCPGHFGHIELVRPVIHSEFSKIVYMILQSTCRNCHRLMLSDEHLKNFGSNLGIAAVAAAAEEEEQGEGQKSSMLKKLKNIRKCERCGTVKGKLKFSAPTYFYIDEYKLKPDEIRDQLLKVSNDDLAVLGMDGKVSRPEWLILSYLLVPPVNVRPSITLESGERSEDDLTHKLVDIMRINQRLEQNLNAGAPQIIIDDLWELLQYHVTTYFNNETSSLPPARHRSGRALKTLTQRLKGKEGRFRYNLSGKRVNYSARTVISVDPNVNIDEVGVPQEIAEKLTVPFYVTEWNIEKAKELLQRSQYPIVINIISKDGKRKRIIDANREEILKSVTAGDILERQLMNGDIVLFNRQPSLHRVSIMSHKVKVLSGKTFRMNYCVTPPYNADFDGDEMNLHVPQTLEARSEAKYLMSPEFQIFSPRDGEVIIANNEDGITGMYLLTRDGTYLTKSEVSYLLSLAGIYDMPKPSKGGLYSGKDVFSMILPKDLDFEMKTGAGPFVVKKGRMIEGTLNKDTYGRGRNPLMTKIGEDFGPQELKRFIFVSSKVADAYVTLAGTTVGVKEYKTDEKLEQERSRLLNETFERCTQLIRDYKARKLEALMGYTLRESLERMIIAELNLVREKANVFLAKYEHEDNNAFQMAQAGSRGSILNIEQMTMFLGQQATLSGGRIKRGYYSNRVLPHIVPNDIKPGARGFVSTCYYSGLAPIDLFMHAVGSRSSEVYKALLTARSGYLYRRLSNALQDYCIDEDYSVRDANNNIIQTIYGGDAINPINVQLSKISAKKSD